MRQGIAFLVAVFLLVETTWAQKEAMYSSINKREAANWEAAGTVSSRGIKFVGATFLLWCAVLIAGRLTAYLGALYA